MRLINYRLFVLDKLVCVNVNRALFKCIWSKSPATVHGAGGVLQRWAEGALWSSSSDPGRDWAPAAACSHSAPGWAAVRSTGVSGLSTCGLLKKLRSCDAAAAAGTKLSRVRCTRVSALPPGAGSGARLQPGHDSCHQEKRRAGLSVRVFSGHAPTAEPG